MSVVNRFLGGVGPVDFWQVGDSDAPRFLGSMRSVVFFQLVAPDVGCFLGGVESVVFCRPSLLQLTLYRHLVKSCVLKSCLTSHPLSGSRHLECINALKRICNDPSLIYSQCQGANDVSDSWDVEEVTVFKL